MTVLLGAVERLGDAVERLAEEDRPVCAVLRLGWVVVRDGCLLTLDDWRLWLEVDLDAAEEERCCEEELRRTEPDDLCWVDGLLTEALERDDVLERDCTEAERDEEDERDGAEYEREEELERDGDAAERDAPPPPDEPRLTEEEERDAPPPPPRD